MHYGDEMMRLSWNIESFLFVLIFLLNMYINYRIIKGWNHAKARNRMMELLSFFLFPFFHLWIRTEITNLVFLLLITAFEFFLLSFHYSSDIRTKGKASLYGVTIGAISELAVVLILGVDRITSLNISKDTLYYFLSVSVIQYITIIFAENMKLCGLQKMKSYSKGFLSLILPVFFVYLNMIYQAEELSVRKIVLAIGIFLYRLFSMMLLYRKQKEEQKFLIQERDDLLDQCKRLEDTSHTIVTVQNCLKNHMIVLQDYISENDAVWSYLADQHQVMLKELTEKEDGIREKLTERVKENVAKLNEWKVRKEGILSYFHHLSLDISSMENVIDTGNQAIDSILNHKIGSAQRKGIVVKHEILIPVAAKVDDYTMTVVLGTFFDAAIEEMEAAQNKYIYFLMKYTGGMILVWLIHGDEMEEGLRKKNRYVYRDDFKMRSVKRMLAKHHGNMQIAVNAGKVEVCAQILCED